MLRQNCILLLLSGFATVSLASCSADEPEIPSRAETAQEEECNGGFIINLPNIASSAYGGASSLECNELQYTIYSGENKDSIVKEGKMDAFGYGVLSANLCLELEKDSDYTIVLYAHNNRSDFSSYSNGKIEVDYSEANTCSELDDAFCGVYDFKADGKLRTVTLCRPFAQLNIGTDDLGGDAVKPKLDHVSGTLTISDGLHSCFDILNNKVCDEVSGEVSFSDDDFSENKSFPRVMEEKDYSLLTEVYLLVPMYRSMIDASYTLKNVSSPLSTLNLSATPVEMNSRSCVYGSLITSPDNYGTSLQSASDATYTAPDKANLNPGKISNQGVSSEKTTPEENRAKNITTESGPKKMTTTMGRVEMKASPMQNTVKKK